MASMAETDIAVTTGEVEYHDQESGLIRVISDDTAAENTITSLRRRLVELYLKAVPTLFNFIDHHIDLAEIDEFESEIIESSDDIALHTLEPGSQKLVIALQRFNDVRRLNSHLRQVNATLSQDGYFVGRGETLAIQRRGFDLRFGVFARFLYPFLFIYSRVMPKLGFTRDLYFWMSAGKNRTFSKAEILGRLYYCGFKVTAVQELADDFYFIAQKVGEPDDGKTPCCGPVIKLPRIGLNGKIIYINKFRTMHPYSEYLQAYIYEQNDLQSNGKFKDDFRITGWGRFLRKYWLDELPQVLNYVRGDINLVGVRAISEHYFNLYPEELRQLRKKFKPGLVPPYYADLPQSFDEIVDSEKSYFDKKLTHCFLTDDLYFFKAVFNILLKQARSH
jgi:hypothetical protein